MIAFKGETVTCENGHAICDVTQDINERSSMKLQQFTAWHGEDHGREFATGHCRICGAAFLRTSLPPLSVRDEAWHRAMPWMSDDDRAHQARRIQLHIGTEWRT